MAKTQANTVGEAVHKLQLALLDGIKDEAQLFAAGSLMSRSDYLDVVTERSIADSCGYPLCPNSLPSERARKGHYRISLKEHKVYDLQETYMYCSSSCLIGSRAFAGSLQDERCMLMNIAKLNEILSMFENLGLEAQEEMGTSGDMGLSKLKIQEKPDVKGGEVAMEEWIGPSNAIEGYVPQRDRKLKALSSKPLMKGHEPGMAKSSKHNDTSQNEGEFKVADKPNGDTSGPRKGQAKKKNSGGTQSKTSKPLLDDLNFTSCIIMDGEYTVSKESDGGAKPVKSNVSKTGSKAKRSASKKGKDLVLNAVDFTSTIIPQFDYSSSKSPSSVDVSDPNRMSSEFIGKLDLGDRGKQIKPSENGSESFMDSAVTETRMITNETPGPSGHSKVSNSCQNDASSSSVVMQDESGTHRDVQSSITRGKSSLKSNGARKLGRSVTWADEKNDDCDSGNLCEVKEFKKTTKDTDMLKGIEGGDNDDPERVASAQACAMALSQAAEAVASGQSDVTDAVSEAGIIVLPQLGETDEGEDPVEDDGLEEAAPVKWPRKPGDLTSDDVFESKDSWFETPPEGFSMTLSPFANMWNALFSWMTSSSLAYIYGRDESCHVEYLFVNGREYPSRVVLPDGRSSEIKQTLAGCLGRASPGVIAALKLPTPVSTLEQGLAGLLETMSFMDALPPFRMKQWQAIVLLFLDALSICRIPGLTPHLTSRRVLIPKVLEGAQISAEEYEIMKELVIPLGRVPQFSMQSGG